MTQGAFRSVGEKEERNEDRIFAHNAANAEAIERVLGARLASQGLVAVGAVVETA